MPRRLRDENYEPLLTGSYSGTTPLTLDESYLPITNATDAQFFVVEIEAYRAGSAAGIPFVAYGLDAWGILPDATASTSVTATIRASDRGYVTRSTDPGGVLAYSPYVSSVEVTRELPVSPKENGLSRADGVVTLLNHNGWLDNFVSAMSADGRRMAVKRGVKAWDDERGIYVDPAYGDLDLVFAGTAGAWFLDADVLRVPLRDTAYLSDRIYQRAQYSGAGGYNGNAGLAGKRKPIVRGGDASHPVRNVELLLIDAANLIYQYTDHAGTVVRLLEGGKATYTFGGNTTDLYTGSAAPGQYRTDNSRGLVQLGTAPQYEMTADVTGAFQTAGAVTNWAMIAYYILTEDVGISTSYVDSVSFAAAAASYPYVAGLAFGSDEAVTGATAASRFVTAAFARCVEDRDGKIDCFVLRALSGTETQVLTISTENCVDIIPRSAPSDLDPPPYRIRVGYLHNHTVQNNLNPTALQADVQFAQAPDTYTVFANAETSAQYVSPNDLEPFGGALLVQADAEAVAAAAGEFLTTRRRYFDCELPTQVAATLDLGSVVKIIWPTGGLRGGPMGQVIREPIRTAEATTTVQVVV